MDDLAEVHDDTVALSPHRRFETGLAIEKISSADLAANEAALLMKLLVHNLVRRWVTARMPVQLELDSLCVVIPSTLLRSGECWPIRNSRAHAPLLN